MLPSSSEALVEPRSQLGRFEEHKRLDGVTTGLLISGHRFCFYVDIVCFPIKAQRLPILEALVARNGR
jgi:hypothetical protein